MTELKTCSRCQTPKSLDDFQKDKSKRDGRYLVCKLCRSPLANASYAKNKEGVAVRAKARYDANPDKYRAESKRYRELHPEYFKEYLRRYYLAHKDRWVVFGKTRDREKVRRRSLVYRVANREKIRAGVRDWFRRHPHAAFQGSSRWRARLAKQGGPIAGHVLDEILEFFGHRCGYCLVDLRTLPKHLRTWDHMMPLIRGGLNTADNVIPCCKPCNSRKKDRHIALMASYIRCRPTSTETLDAW